MQRKEWNLIDFHAKFTEEYMQWCLQHQQQLAQDEADTDDLYYEMYAEWLDQPKDLRICGKRQCWFRHLWNIFCRRWKCRIR